ncbi:hypothetical protein ACHAXR_007289 [Thalassiosira sp. AJA248-18]
MSIRSISASMFRFRPKTSAATTTTIPMQWSRSSKSIIIPTTRFSIVCSTAMAMTLSIVITAKKKVISIPSSTTSCEAEQEGTSQMPCCECSPAAVSLFTSSYCPSSFRRHQDYPMMFLASSPASSSSSSSLENSKQSATTTTARRSWWRFQLLRTSSNPQKKKSSSPQSYWNWLQRIGQTFFVITRGIEIVARLSPLLILTPTSMVVSIIDPLLSKGYFYFVGLCKKWNDNINVKTTFPVMDAHDDDYHHREQEKTDDILFATHQFQDFNSNNNNNLMIPHNIPHQATWASNLAWRYTIHTMQCLGPAFCKLAQWAATRRDLFPVHICNRLSELHDTARQHDWKYTQEALVEAFGDDYESRGLVVTRRKNDGSDDDDDDDFILGSGSAAQVHKGTLTISPRTRRTSSDNTSTTTTTKTVAIKVLHPNIRQLVERDLALMQHMADFINACIPLEAVRMLSLPRAVTNFANVMERQVDLRIEGNNLRIFRENFGCSSYYHDDSTIKSFSHPPPTITFPCPEREWISERVLVEEHAGDDAVPISRFLADGSPEGLKIRKRLAGPLLRAFLKMVFIDNFIHADLHPGFACIPVFPSSNVLVRAAPNKHNTKRMNYTIIFLDAGIATSLKPNDRKNLHDLFKAVVLNDGYTAGLLMVERARFERCTTVPSGKHAFASGVADIVAQFHDRRKQGLTLGAVRVGALLGQMLDLCRRYGVEIDPAMSSVVVSMLVLEGLGRSLDPDLNLIKAAIPFLF